MKKIKLTEKEIKDGFFVDIVLGKCNIRKALEDRDSRLRSEHEAFCKMHITNSTNSKSERFSKL